MAEAGHGGFDPSPWLILPRNLRNPRRHRLRHLHRRRPDQSHVGGCVRRRQWLVGRRSRCGDLGVCDRTCGSPRARRRLGSVH